MSTEPMTMEQYRAQAGTSAEPQRVTVVDFDMSFTHMVVFLVKLAIAAIPAAIILFVIGMFLIAVFGGIAGA